MLGLTPQLSSRHSKPIYVGAKPTTQTQTPTRTAKPTAKPAAKKAAAKKPTPKTTPKSTPKVTALAPVTETPNSVKLSAEYLEAALPRFKALYGIGDVLGNELIRTLAAAKLIPRTVEGITNMKDETLRNALRDKKIYSTLPLATKMDLDEHPLDRVPRKLIKMMEKEIDKALDGQKSTGIKVTVAGSYLRGAKTSGDIDLVLQTSTKPARSPAEAWTYFRELINKESNLLHIKEPFGVGNDKIGTAFEIRVPPSMRDDEHIKDYIDDSFKVRFKADIFLTTPAEYELALLYATGSGIFNIRMRYIAKKKGYLLNQHGLYKVQGKKLVDTGIKTQKEIFEALNMKYREPNRRNV